MLCCKFKPASFNKAPKATKQAAKGIAGLRIPILAFSPLRKILEDLQKAEKKTIILVEQNAKKGLEFADIGYVLVSGQTAIAGKGNDLLKNPDVGRLFLGG